MVGFFTQKLRRTELDQALRSMNLIGLLNPIQELERLLCQPQVQSDSSVSVQFLIGSKFTDGLKYRD